MYHTPLKKHSLLQAGFSLVELSVVLLIIALLVAGIVAGKDIIRDSELKSMITQVNQVKTATNAFKLLYNRLPGDMENATDYWPDTHNGNHNGRIESEPTDEAFLALQHLANAKFISKTYSGAWNGEFVIGQNVLNVAGAGAGLYLHCCDEGEATRPLSRENHVTVFSVNTTTKNLREGTLTPIEAWGIDNKFDDGIPDTGMVWSSGNYHESGYIAQGCYSSEGASSIYATTDAAYKNTIGCQIHFQYE